MTPIGPNDEGHKEEPIYYTEIIKNGLSSLIPFDEIYISTLATFGIMKSFKDKKNNIIRRLFQNIGE